MDLRDPCVEAAAEDTRADFFRKAALGGGGLVAGGSLLAALPDVAGAQTRRDVQILNFALTLEFLEDEFYKQAVRDAGITGDLLRLTRLVSNHETIHVNFLRKALGRAAIAKPTFDFGAAVTNCTTFLDTAIVLEDTGVAAYAGQGPQDQGHPGGAARLRPPADDAPGPDRRRQDRLHQELAARPSHGESIGPPGSGDPAVCCH